MTGKHSHGPHQSDTGRQRLGLRVIVGGATLLLLLLYSSAVAVKERHTALITRFGRLVRTIEEPGLRWKMPWPIEAEVLVDRRLSLLGTVPTEALTLDRKNVVLECFTAWRVVEPAEFHRALGSVERAQQVLGEVVTTKLGTTVGEYALSALVSTDTDDLSTPDIEARILAAVREAVRGTYGIEVERVGIKRLAFPEDNIEPVFEQMRAERKKVADEARAIGRAEADTIARQTQEEVRGLMAEALRDAQIIRGRAETDIARMIGDVKDLDPEFFSFMVRMNALEKMITNDTAIYVSTGQSPFDLLNVASSETEED